MLVLSLLDCLFDDAPRFLCRGLGYRSAGLGKGGLHRLPGFEQVGPRTVTRVLVHRLLAGTQLAFEVLEVGKVLPLELELRGASLELRGPGVDVAPARFHRRQ